MIKANELRIGNRILINGVPVTIGYAAIMICAQQEKGLNNEDKFEPIPLTPEILSKCTFISPNFTIEQIYPKGFYFEIKPGYVVQIESLHELQNFHFAVTKTELNFKP